jgi:hypothetical protein
MNIEPFQLIRYISLLNHINKRLQGSFYVKN